MLEKVIAQLSAAASRHGEAAAQDDDQLPAMAITVG
jgi:hypothetical protein